MTDAGDVLQTLAPVLASFAVLAGIGWISARRQAKRERKP